MVKYTVAGQFLWNYKYVTINYNYRSHLEVEAQDKIHERSQSD